MRRYAFAAGPLAAAAIWGGMYVVSKWGFARIPPLTLGFLRVAIAAAVLYAVVGRRTVEFDPGDHRRLLVLGGWVAATVATQFVGTELTNASQASLLTVLTPVFTVWLGAAVLGETVTAGKAAGVALAAAGTLVVLAGQYDPAAMAAGNAAGVGLLLVGSLCWAGYTVWGLPVVRRHSALTAATYSTAAAVPVLGVAAAVELYVVRPPLAPAVSPGALLAVLYLGVASTALAWYLWYVGLAHVPAGTVAVFFFAQPVVGAALGAAFLGESVGAGFVAGGALMGAGIWLVGRERSVATG